MEATMEDIVLIKALFVAGLFMLSGVALIAAHAIARIAEWARTRGGRATPRRPMKDIPVRGTR
jgi:hypothetical protein